jgi:hypothetical protein
VHRLGCLLTRKELFFEIKNSSNCNKASGDTFSLRNESLQESEVLPDAGVLVEEIVHDLESVLKQFRKLLLIFAGDEIESGKS